MEGDPDRQPWLVLHVDLDQFLVAIEVRRRPELAGRPVVVGGTGDPTVPRTVAACASYEARALGVHAGMPLRTALRRCPEAVFLPTDPAACEAASAGVMDALRATGLPVQVWGWDEAFLGARSTEPVALGRALQDAVRRATALACSVGIGDSKQRAKLATGFAKPGGVFHLTAQEWPVLVGPRPTSALWGVGPRTARRLTELGLHTVSDVAAADREALVAALGARTGSWLWEAARGGGDAGIDTAERVPRSRSRQTTYPRDLTDHADVAAAVAVLAREVGDEVVREGRTVTRVAVVVRTSSFWTGTRIARLPQPSRDVAAVERLALEVLDRFGITRPVRLLGVRLELADPLADQVPSSPPPGGPGPSG